MKIKNISTLFSAVFLLLFAAPTFAQDCEAWFPMEQGVTYEQKTYNQKDKLQGMAKMKVSEVSHSGDQVEATIQVENFDKKEKAVNEGEFTVGCQGGDFWMDMSSLINVDQFTQGMEASAEGDNLGIPANVKPGDALPDASMSISMSSGGMVLKNMEVKIYDRKVEAFETITTPAGTFECIKISQKSEMNFMFKIQTRSIAWYAKNTGMVRSEDYDKNGKLQGYTLLTSISR